MLNSFLKANKKFVTFSVVLLSCVMVFSVVARTFAIDLSANQARKNELEMESVRLNGIIDEAKKSKLTAVDKKTMYEQKKSLITQQLNEINEEIYQQNQKIANQEKIISEREEQLEEDKENLKVRITAIYTAGESTTLDCILNAKDFNDFMDKSYILKSVSERDSLMIDNAKILLAKLNEEKSILEENREQLKLKKIQLNAQKNEYLNLIAETNDWMKQLDADEQKAIRDIDNNNLEIQQIDEKIAQYYEEQRLLREQKRYEEEQRKLAENRKLQQETQAYKQEETTQPNKLNQDEQTQIESSSVKATELDSTQVEIQQYNEEQLSKFDSQLQSSTESNLSNFESKSDSTTEVSLNTETNSTTTETEAKIESTTEVKSEIKSESETEFTPESKPETKAESAIESDQNAELVLQSDSDPNSGSELDSEISIETELKMESIFGITSTFEPEVLPGKNGLIWPVPGFTWLSSEYNESREGYSHGGIDIAGAGIYGQPIVAAASGTVSTSWYCEDGWGGGYGTYCMIDHDGGRSTLYGHMCSIIVSPGQYVEQGQIIGYVGSTGDSTGPHLHFETRQDGVRYNPMLEF